MNELMTCDLIDQVNAEPECEDLRERMEHEALSAMRDLDVTTRARIVATLEREEADELDAMFPEMEDDCPF